MQIRFRKTWGASLTVYFTLLIACVGAVIFALVEIVRFYGLDSNGAEYTNLAEESLFAGYQPVLLEKYDMFWLDGGFGKSDFDIRAGEEEMEALLYDNLLSRTSGFGINFYRMRVEGVTAEKYLLATDREGKVFQNQAAGAYLSKLGSRAGEKTLSLIKEARLAQQEGGDPEGQIAQAESGLKEIRQQEKQSGKGENSANLAPEVVNGSGTKEKVSNPLEINKDIRKKDILSLVLPAGAVVSEKSIDLSKCLLNRKCEKGTDQGAIETKGSDRIFMQQYIEEYGGNFVEPSPEGGLSYGEEYVIAGRKSDRDNLKYVVKELLLLREAVNFAFLNTDETKKKEAMTVAAALAGITVNPLLVEAIKQGILAVWAYAESICDVKILLSGGKIPLEKNAGSWNVELSKLEQVVSGNYKGTDRGQTYEDYLQVLMYLVSTKKVSYRCMDLMEHAMKAAGYENARMDHMILKMKIQAEYSSDTIFLSLLGKDTVGGYHFQKESSYCYQ